MSEKLGRYMMYTDGRYRMFTQELFLPLLGPVTSLVLYKLLKW